jgi:hypothetical protein
MVFKFGAFEPGMSVNSERVEKNGSIGIARRDARVGPVVLVQSIRP